MPGLEFAEHAQQWVNVVLIWVGFGTLAGLVARVVLPIREPSGPMASLFLGALGSVIGLLILSFLLNESQLNPISPLGFLAASVSAFCLLILYSIVNACIPNREEGPGE